MGIVDVSLQSFSSVSLLGALVVLFIVYVISVSTSSSKNGPPGPRPMPVVGNLLQMDPKRPYNTLMEFYKKYGSVFTVWFGPKKVVVLAGYKTVKEALVNNGEVFGDRDPLPIALEAAESGHYGVTWSNNEPWKEMRRFALTNLRDFGMGKRVCEDKIIEEARYLMDVFKSFKGKPFDTTQPMNYAVSNIICSMVYGSRFEYDDPEFTSFIYHANRKMQLAGSPSFQIYNLFPWLGRLVPSRNEFLKLAELNKQQNRKILKNLKETLNPQMCRGFVDAFVTQQKTVEESGVTNSPFHDENLLQTVFQLFSGGTETATTTLRWAMLIMARYPKIQDQVHEEINRVIGSRQVQLNDRKVLPFTDAVIHETQRFTNIVPMALPHRTSQDITFQGHYIEQGTTVYPLLTSVLYDETEWERPHSFYPAHFLDKVGKFVKRDAFMPFSAGRRICPGEGLARMELFIFFVTLMQHFRFCPPPGVTEEEVELTPINGIFHLPAPYELCAVPSM